MKTILNLILLACSSSLFAQKFDKVSDYCNFFVREFNNIQKQNLQYMAVCVHGTDEEIVQIRKKLVDAATQAVKKYEKVSAMPQDYGFKLSAIEAMKEFKESIYSDYKQEAVKKAGCTECFERVLYEREFSKEESKRAQAAVDKMTSIYEKFAAANNLEFQAKANTEETSEALKKTSRIMTYLNELKLVIAQVEYNWDAVLKAIEEKKVDEAKQALELLKIALPKAQTRLAAIKKIEDDNLQPKTAIATVSAFLAYQTQSVEKYYPQLISCFDTNNEIKSDKITGYNNVMTKLIDQFNSTHGAYVDAHNQLREQSINPELQDDPKLQPLPKEKNSSTQK